jgi:hypothetical protein
MLQENRTLGTGTPGWVSGYEFANGSDKILCGLGFLTYENQRRSRFSGAVELAPLTG